MDILIKNLYIEDMSFIPEHGVVPASLLLGVSNDRNDRLVLRSQGIEATALAKHIRKKDMIDVIVSPTSNAGAIYDGFHHPLRDSEGRLHIIIKTNFFIHQLKRHPRPKTWIARIKRFIQKGGDICIAKKLRFSMRYL